MTIFYENIPLTLLIKVLFIISIVCDALSDAIIDDEKKRDHGLELASIAALLLAFVPVVILVYYSNYMFGWMLVRMAMMTGGSYLLLRSGMFNPIYNYMREPRLPYDYLGDSDKWFDKTWLLRKLQKIEREWIPIFGKRIPFPALTIFYMFSFFIGIFL